jgi:hypothetical protein
LQQVSTWYEVDPKHPDAVEKAKELCQFYKSLLQESVKLSKMYQEVAPATLTGVSKEERELWLGRDKKIEEVLNDDGIDSKLRQLEAMGFDHTLDGWK